MKEPDLKLAVSEYLEYKTNLGELYADRLNSGEVIIMAGFGSRRIKLCREGTADFFIIQAIYFEPKPSSFIPKTKICRIIFLELKGDKGKQSPEQGAFQKLVESQGAEYYIVRSIEELSDILQ